MQPERASSTQTVGPYRLLERLGSGGMGEVFLAYDERLDRQVAIKRIRPEAGVTPERRERFRREARMAARLSHPAIVQVFDILQENDTDSIVMEYVEGTNLRDMVDDGPLDVATVVELARELADGLEAAHRAGIVHRDLKTENVLVGASGRPKVTDFGIAKRLLAGEGEESLTGDHMIVGTCRSMSPEQARGEPVDHRADLFALGVLLYEMLTGRSPFAAETPLATLTRVLHHRQTPVRELVPAVPEELSNLVDHLLEKDANLRPRSAGQVRRELDRLALTLAGAGGTETILEIVPSSTGRPQDLPSRRTVEATPPPTAPAAVPARRSVAVLASLVVLAGLGIWLFLALRRPAPPLYVAVLAPETGNAGGADAGEIALLASGVRVALLQGLVALEGISPQAFEEVDSVSGSPREVARAVAADEVLGTRLDCGATVCRVALTRRKGTDGSVIWAESLDVPTDDTAVVAGAVRGRIQQGYRGYALREGMATPPASARDLDAYLRLRQQFDAGRDRSLETILAGIEALRQRSPRYLEVYLLEAEALRYRFWKSRDARDLDRALRLVDQARSLAPDDPRPLFELVGLALDGRKLDLARQGLDRLGRLVPGDARLLREQAHFLAAEGKSGQALELMRTAARLQPSSSHLHNLAQMEYREGQVAAARQTLERLLQRSPGNYNGLFLLAQIELSGGDLDRAVELHRRLVRISPGMAEITNLGLAYMFLGRSSEAEAAFRRARDLEPQKPIVVLNLADACLLVGRKAEADTLYRQVVALIEKDPAAGSPQFLTIKGQALAHLGQGPQAVAAVQEALQLAPDQGPVAFEASLVYALVGEESSAFVHAEKAIQQGIGERWFSLPWFGDLKKRADFQGLLRQARPGLG